MYSLLPTNNRYYQGFHWDFGSLPPNEDPKDQPYLLQRRLGMFSRVLSLFTARGPFYIHNVAKKSYIHATQAPKSRTRKIWCFGVILTRFISFRPRKHPSTKGSTLSRPNVRENTLSAHDDRPPPHAHQLGGYGKPCLSRMVFTLSNCADLCNLSNFAS